MSFRYKSVKSRAADCARLAAGVAGKRGPRTLMLALAMLHSATAAADKLSFSSGPRQVTLLELYTSQGCSSCPPAERWLNEYIDNKDLWTRTVPLAFHVDYWDYIGWKDLFARPSFTSRQRNYVRSLRSRYAYTPQMVISGQTHVVGSDRGKVEKQISRLQKSSSAQPELSLRRDGDSLIVSVGAADTSEKYDVTFVTFDKPHVTKVNRGENRGQTLVNANVVRELAVIGKWSGKAANYSVSLAGKKGDGGCAIIIQKRGPGSVLIAASLPFEH